MHIMDIKLFSLIVKRLGDKDLDDFSCQCGNKYYRFKTIDDNWEDDGKYQYRTEQGQLIEMNKNYKEIQSFNFGISREVSRSGSYFTDYYYTNDDYEMFEIEEIVIPEVVIPEHKDQQWNKLNIDISKFIDEEEENKKRIEAERTRLENEVKAEKDRLANLYSMNRQDILKMVSRDMKKKDIKFTIVNMRKEYFDIVVKKNLESKEWIEYHKELQEFKEEF